MSGMEHVSAPLGRVLASIGMNPHSRTPIYSATGRRIFCRTENPHWLSLDEAKQEAFRLTAVLVSSDDPGEVLPLITQLSWAIHDARQTDPTPPAANAMAVPEQRAA